MSSTARVWLALGSNLGDSNAILQQAWQELGHKRAIRLITLSSPYETEPVAMESENRFLNAVGILETDLAPEPLLALLQSVEKHFGREKKTGKGGYQDRLLDLDILYYDDRLLNSAHLQLPHPHRAERLFVLAPLVEIDAGHHDPITSHTVEHMYKKLLQRMASGEKDLQEITRAAWM